MKELRKHLAQNYPDCRLRVVLTQRDKCGNLLRAFLLRDRPQIKREDFFILLEMLYRFLP